ncbi:MAG: SRPBCC family protein [Flectobacillus sp.]|uniref:SRPBCC family protein n=1 Tax=Flectobacillus sp. TaxID=50419 RepID=UPI003B9D8C71
MNIFLKTPVEQSIQEVWEGFDEKLFKALAPPFPPFRVLRFDGCVTGDKVGIELDFIFFKQNWESDIVEHQKTEEEYFFVDKGTKLPFFLSSWQHKHRIVRVHTQTYIIDDIKYNTPNIILDFLIYPVLYLQFLYRKPIYKRYFKT